MKFSGLIHTLPSNIKWFLATFIIVLSVGYFTGLLFISHTESNSPKGIQENYLGNEDVADTEVMKFKKSKREMLTILHTHILSISFIFFILGSILSITSVPKRLKSFLMIEPFISIILTFGGIYFMWAGVRWMRYIVMISGIVMTGVYIISVGLIFYQLLKKTDATK
jgi:hypothetical protein